MQPLADDILLVQLKAGDSDSFQLLYKIYFPSVASYIKRNMGNTEDAEDIFQEAILVLLQKGRISHRHPVASGVLRPSLIHALRSG